MLARCLQSCPGFAKDPGVSQHGTRISAIPALGMLSHVEHAFLGVLPNFTAYFSWPVEHALDSIGSDW